ncbi:MAG: hypothetical protein M5U33_00700 [Pseudorhodoplanes sp.]|nr:hypothetical protein [Pseudorhodoplanes sp.]
MQVRVLPGPPFRYKSGHFPRALLGGGKQPGCQRGLGAAHRDRIVGDFDALDDLAHIALAHTRVLGVQAFARRQREQGDVLAADELLGDRALLFERPDESQGFLAFGFDAREGLAEQVSVFDRSFRQRPV